MDAHGSHVRQLGRKSAFQYVRSCSVLEEYEALFYSRTLEVYQRIPYVSYGEMSSVWTRPHGDGGPKAYLVATWPLSVSASNRMSEMT